jgi:hypothetical protein
MENHETKTTARISVHGDQRYMSVYHGKMYAHADRLDVEYDEAKDEYDLYLWHGRTIVAVVTVQEYAYDAGVYEKLKVKNESFGLKIVVI